MLIRQELRRKGKIRDEKRNYGAIRFRNYVSFLEFFALYIGANYGV